jgi:GTP:adenosylcobinamide-phosphate guanylyltransferase/predicted HAD superfamily phosphohydrolase YqeG
MLENIKIQPNIVDTIKELKNNGYKIACCSNSIRKSVFVMLSKIGIIEYMDLILSNEDVKNSKPHPEIYWKAMSMMNLLPEQTLIVEDSPPGLLSANRSNAHVLRINKPIEITFNKIMEKIQNLTNNIKTKWTDQKLNVLIPRAGAGSRFEKAGYTFPKPLIEVNGKPMIQVVVENLNIDANYIFIVQKSHREKYNLDTLLNLISPNCNIIDVDGIIPLIPHEFAVVPEDSVTLTASTINPIAEFNTYRFEIDTTDLFNSSQKRFALISGFGGLKSVNPSEWYSSSSGNISPLVCTDSMVYFWRVALESSLPDWRERSFQYIKGKSGWGQDHFFQFKKNSFSNVFYNRALRERQFVLDSQDSLKSVVLPGPGNLNETKINGQRLDYGVCDRPTPTLNVVVFDAITLDAWSTRYVPTGSNLNRNYGNSKLKRDKPVNHLFKQKTIYFIDEYAVYQEIKNLDWNNL